MPHGTKGLIHVLHVSRSITEWRLQEDKEVDNVKDQKGIRVAWCLFVVYACEFEDDVAGPFRTRVDVGGKPDVESTSPLRKYIGRGIVKLLSVLVSLAFSKGENLQESGAKGGSQLP